jgi:hypothetical protein
VTITTMLAASLWLATASSASTPTVVKQCAQGRAASYKLKSSDKAFLEKYLSCVLGADGLGTNTTNTVSVSGEGCTSGSGCSANFATLMAPTIASFATAAKSDNNVNYINSKISAVYQNIDPPTGDWYTIWGDTSPPSPTLAGVAAEIAPAYAPIVRGWTSAPQLAIDIVVQKGAWFHSGRANNLRYMVLINAV